MLLHISCTKNEDVVDDQILDKNLFSISLLSPQFFDIANILVAG